MQTMTPKTKRPVKNFRSHLIAGALLLSLVTALGTSVPAHAGIFTSDEELASRGVNEVLQNIQASLLPFKMKPSEAFKQDEDCPMLLHSAEIIFKPKVTVKFINLVNFTMQPFISIGWGRTLPEGQVAYTTAH
jgi:hypothetical protein